jgi:hypothetical protein
LKRKTINTAIICIVTLLLGVCYVSMVRPMQLRARYERTLVSMKRIDSVVTGARYPRSTTIAEVSAATGSSLPSADAWGRPFRFSSDGSSSYLLGSAGSDGKWEHTTLEKYTSDGHNWYDSDIVVRNSVVVHGRYSGTNLREFAMRD